MSKNDEKSSNLGSKVDLKWHNFFDFPFILDLFLTVCFGCANGEGVGKEEVELVSVCVLELSVEHTDEGMEMISILTLGLIFFSSFSDKEDDEEEEKELSLNFPSITRDKEDKDDERSIILLIILVLLVI